MACGCPVISSTRGSLGEVVGDAAALVEPEDVGSIATQLEAVATSSAVLDRLREAGLKQATKVDCDRPAAATLAIYKAAQHPARTHHKVNLFRKESAYTAASSP